MAIFNNLGNMLAPLTAFVVTALIGAEGMADYGWRVPFILGGLLGLIVLWLRRTLPESLPASRLAGAAPTGAADTGKSTGGVWSGVRKYWLSVLAIIFIVGAIQAYNYTWLSGLPSLATGTYSEDPTGVFAVAPQSASS